MHASRFSWLLSVVAIVAAASRACADEPKLSLNEFTKLHKELTSVKEPWQSIPWQLSLLEARALAAMQNKPVYMLCRAGHPLGCV